jgi:zinc transport system substrate-binding protein
VVASFYPLYEFASRIGGAHAEVRSLVPPGAEPHDYEPSARDIAALSGVRLLIYNGAGFEPWVDRLLPALPPSVVRVKATAGLPLATIGGAPDPHVWLDPVLAQRQADAILRGFDRADPARRAVYQESAAALRDELEALHQRYTATLARCQSRTFVTAHAAFGYLARRYGLTMIAVGGLSREVEPSPARLKQVVLLVRRHGARAIYFDAAASPKVAQTIAREVGVQTRVLNPLERLPPEGQRRGAGYLEVMDENLRQLAQGLGCR